MPDTGDDIQADNARWSFAQEVPARFDDHIRRSVPLYEAGHELLLGISDFFVQDGSRIYELGCSTGQLTRQLWRRHGDRGIELIAVDREPGMLERARAKCGEPPGLELRGEEIETLALQPADLIVAYYTLQFVRPRFRQQVFDRIYQGLNWGGGFLLFEKVRAPDARFQDMMTSLYTDYKLAQGFSEAEIVHKARSLKGVLEPFSSQGNLDLLARAGFVDVMTVFKYGSFEGFLAIK